MTVSDEPLLRGAGSPRRVAVGIALLALVGAGAAALVAAGNPGNMGLCGACFLRDLGGALGLIAPGPKGRPAAVRPELVGLMLGALGLAVAVSWVRVMADWLRDRAGLSPEISDRWLWALQGRGWIRVNHMPLRRQRSVVVTRQGRAALKAERERLQARGPLSPRAVCRCAPGGAVRRDLAWLPPLTGTTTTHSATGAFGCIT